MYGTLEDFKQLVSRAKELGIKIIMDLVPNHTSNKHQWFQLSENRTEGYEDFYVWHDGIPNKDNQSLMDPPNNWVSYEFVLTFFLTFFLIFTYQL